MSAFDAQINVTHIEVAVTEKQDRLVVNLILSQALPLAEPGTSKPLMAPIGKFNFPLDRDSALQIGRQLTEEGEKLKEPSKLEVASNMQEAEAVGSVMKGVVGGR